MNGRCIICGKIEDTGGCPRHGLSQSLGGSLYSDVHAFAARIAVRLREMAGCGYGDVATTERRMALLDAANEVERMASQ